MEQGQAQAGQPTPVPTEQLLREQVAVTLRLLETVATQKSLELQQQQQAQKAQEPPRKGKPLHGFLEFSSFFSTQASTVSRSLALAGVAIIWLFKKPDDHAAIVKGDLNFELWCLALSLALDLLQYFFGALAWNIFYEVKFHRWKKGGFKPEYARDIEAPNWISVPIKVLFVLKIGFMIVAYCGIIAYLMRQL